jgi:hypothetical protein
MTDSRYTARPTWHREGRAFVLLAPPAPGTRNRKVIGWTAYQRGRKVWAYAALHTDARRTTGDVPRGRDAAARGRAMVETLLGSA